MDLSASCTRFGRAYAAFSWIAGICLTVMASGCGGSHASEMRTTSAAEDIPILWQASGTYSRIGHRARILARDRATLAQVPLTAVPVDFTKQMVLIAALGPTASSEQGIRIVRVWRQGSTIHVQERPIHPGAERAAGLQPASPWTIVVIPRSDLNVEGYTARVPEKLLRDHPGSR